MGTTIEELDVRRDREEMTSDRPAEPTVKRWRQTIQLSRSWRDDIRPSSWADHLHRRLRARPVCPVGRPLSGVVGVRAWGRPSARPPARPAVGTYSWGRPWVRTCWPCRCSWGERGAAGGVGRVRWGAAGGRSARARGLAVCGRQRRPAWWHTASPTHTQRQTLMHRPEPDNTILTFFLLVFQLDIRKKIPTV